VDKDGIALHRMTFFENPRQPDEEEPSSKELRIGSQQRHLVGSA
jgi:hypothetical protein